ncbi:MAG TPA: glycosyltransferase [Candidatus Avilachnospira avistercoris]|nr:glycosyltransferase [Candidatus Avilachnospira avistercoris]
MTLIRPDIIIPVYKPKEAFRRQLLMLSRQTLLPKRLILINTEESLLSDEMKSFIRELDSDEASGLFGCIELKHIKKSEFDHAATRSYGISLGRSPVFICMTDDAVPCDERLIERLCEGILERKGPKGEPMAMAYARQLPREDCGMAEAYTRGFNYPETPLIKTKADIERLGIKAFFASNVCCAYQRKIFEELGGFIGRAIFNEDMIYAHKALMEGYGISYEAEAKVLHSHDLSAMEQLHRNFDLGMSQSMNKEVFDGIRSEGEGIRLVLSTARYLLSKGKLLSVIRLFWNSGFRYLGYLLGRHYETLPKKAVSWLCSNKTFVKRMYEDRETAGKTKDLSKADEPDDKDKDRGELL